MEKCPGCGNKIKLIVASLTKKRIESTNCKIIGEIHKVIAECLNCGKRFTVSLKPQMKISKEELNV